MKYCITITISSLRWCNDKGVRCVIMVMVLAPVLALFEVSFLMLRRHSKSGISLQHARWRIPAIEVEVLI